MGTAFPFRTHLDTAALSVAESQYIRGRYSDDFSSACLSVRRGSLAGYPEEGLYNILGTE